METFIIKIEANTSASKNLITFLRDLAKGNKDIKVIEGEKLHTAQSILSGLEDVKKILSGKKKGKTLDELLDEN